MCRDRIGTWIWINMGVSGCIFQLHCINLYQSICQMLDCFPWENCQHETPGKVILKPHNGYKRNKESVVSFHIYQPSRIWISGQLIFIPWLLPNSGSWAPTHSCTVSVLVGWGGGNWQHHQALVPGPHTYCWQEEIVCFDWKTAKNTMDNLSMFV